MTVSYISEVIFSEEKFRLFIFKQREDLIQKTIIDRLRKQKIEIDFTIYQLP